MEYVIITVNLNLEVSRLTSPPRPISQLFTASSLREANRSTTMSRYVIIFTVVTVLYLPPSFMSVRWCSFSRERSFIFNRVPLDCIRYGDIPRGRPGADEVGV